MHPPVDHVTAEIEAARAARECVRPLRSDDPERHEALTAAYEALRDCWTLDHQRYVRSLPRSAAAVDTDPVRVAQRQRRAEMIALHKALNPTSGRPRPKAKRVTSQQMFGTVGQVRQFVNATREEHDQVKRLLGRGRFFATKAGGRYISMGDLNEEAAALLADTEAMRTKLNTYYRRYRQRVDRFGRQGDVTGKVIALVEGDDDEIGAREMLNDLAAELRQSAKRSKPLTARELRAAGAQTRNLWPVDRVERTLQAFVSRHGRMPTKRELAADSGLPHYTTLRRIYGRRPLNRLDKILVSTVTN